MRIILRVEQFKQLRKRELRVAPGQHKDAFEVNVLVYFLSSSCNLGIFDKNAH